MKTGKGSCTSVHHQPLVTTAGCTEVEKLEVELEACKLQPRVEGRIVQMTAKVGTYIDSCACMLVLGRDPQ